MSGASTFNEYSKFLASNWEPISWSHKKLYPLHFLVWMRKDFKALKFRIPCHWLRQSDQFEKLEHPLVQLYNWNKQVWLQHCQIFLSWLWIEWFFPPLQTEKWNPWSNLIRKMLIFAADMCHVSGLWRPHLRNQKSDRLLSADCWVRGRRRAIFFRIT